MKFRDLTKRKMKKHSLVALTVAAAAAAVVVGVSVPGSRGNSEAGTLPKVTKTTLPKLPKKPVSHGLTWKPSNQIPAKGGTAVISWHVTGAKSCDMIVTKNPYAEVVTYPTKWVNCSGGYYREGIKFGPNLAPHTNVIHWLLTASTAPVPTPPNKGAETSVVTTGHGPPVALGVPYSCTGAAYTSPCPPLE